jgi:hypothetical protein
VNDALFSADPVNARLVVPVIGSAGAGLPAAVFPKPPELVSVLPVKLPYETQWFLSKADASEVFPLKHTFPEMGEMTAGMVKFGSGRPGMSLKASVASRT